MFKLVYCQILIHLYFINAISSEQIFVKNSYRSGDTGDESKSVLIEENEKSNRMVEIIFEKEPIAQNMIDCFLYGDKELADNAISKRSSRPEVRKVTSKEFSDWAHKCSQLLIEKIRNGEIEKYYDNDFPEDYNNKIDRNFFDGLMIYPGTKWCGAGDIAEDHDDLGTEVETDVCCRQHDYCFDNIIKGENKYNLTNKAIHTKSHCYCDEEFQSCLRSANTGTAKIVAKLYFNLIQVQCFRKDHPILKCLEYKGIPLFWKSCQRYELDYKQNMIYQFFDAKFF